MSWQRCSTALLLLSAACGTRDPDPGTDDGSLTTDGTAAATSTTGASAMGDGESGDTPACEDPERAYHLPASCPDASILQLPEAGCYASCAGPGDACEAGLCTEVQTDPCPCPPDAGDCCQSCAASLYLCIEGLPDSCEQVVGTTFFSVEEMECGLGPMGVELCPWEVTFSEDGTFEWLYSDLGETGTYTCLGGAITLTSGPAVFVFYDPIAEVLSWDGVEYVPAPA